MIWPSKVERKNRVNFTEVCAGLTVVMLILSIASNVWHKYRDLNLNGSLISVNTIIAYKQTQDFLQTGRGESYKAAMDKLLTNLSLMILDFSVLGDC